MGNIELKVLTPEEYNKKAKEYYAAGDINGFLDFQKTYNILYADPIFEQDKEFLNDIEIPKMSDDIKMV